LSVFAASLTAAFCVAQPQVKKIALLSKIIILFFIISPVYKI
jgi:hypothetical protein